MADIKRLDPKSAYALLQERPRARLLDVRSRVEFDYVGHPVGALHVAWKEFPQWQENPAFAAEAAAALTDSGAGDPHDPVLLICRSGARSYAAAERLAAQGFTELYNVEEGFEGDRDSTNHRGNLNGWRFHGLPWEQG